MGLINKTAKKQMINPDAIGDKEDTFKGRDSLKEERVLKSPDRMEIEEEEKKEQSQPQPKAFYDDWDNNLFADNMNDLQKTASHQPTEFDEER